MPKTLFAGLPLRRHRIVLGWIVLPSLVFGGIALALACWPISTQVAMQLQTQSLQFSPINATGELWDGSLKFTALDFQGLQKLSLPGDWPLSENGKPVSTTTQPRAWLGAESPRAELHLATAGWLNAVHLRPASELSLVAIGNRQFTLRWLESPQTLLIVPIGHSQLQGHYLHRTALDQPRIDDLDLQISPPPNQPFEVAVQAGATVTISTETILLLPKALPLSKLAFNEQNSEGEPVCSLRGELKLRYPDFPERAEKTLPAPDSCQIQSASAHPLELSELRFNDKGDGWLLTVTGNVTELTLGREDYRLNALETLWTNDLAKIVFAIVTWMASLALGAYKFLKEESKS
ncbi:MAG: hypothetical protein ABL919_13170 [Methylococcales bacterium]